MTFNTAIQQLGSATATFVGGKIITQDGHHALLGYNKVGYFSIVLTLISVGFVYIIKLYHVPPSVPE